MIIRSSQQNLVTTIAKVAVLNFKSLNLSHFLLQRSLQNKLLNSFFAKSSGYVCIHESLCGYVLSQLLARSVAIVTY